MSLVNRILKEAMFVDKDGGLFDDTANTDLKKLASDNQNEIDSTQGIDWYSTVVEDDGSCWARGYDYKMNEYIRRGNVVNGKPVWTHVERGETA